MASSLPPVGATSPYTLSMASAYQRIARAAPGTSSRRLWRIGLPVSRVSSSASSSRWASIRSANLCSTALRWAGEACDQSPRSKTPRAAWTARSTSAFLPRATSASVCWAVGSTVANTLLSAAALYSPLINSRVSIAILFAFSCQ